MSPVAHPQTVAAIEAALDALNQGCPQIELVRQGDLLTLRLRLLELTQDDEVHTIDYRCESASPLLKQITSVRQRLNALRERLAAPESADDPHHAGLRVEVLGERLTMMGERTWDQLFSGKLCDCAF
jgi:hypothetical protein